MPSRGASCERVTTTTIDPNVDTLNKAIVLYAEAANQTAVRDRAYAARPTGAVNHAPHSDAWWHGVSVCEQGGRNDSFFGYFSIMDGSAGGLPWAEQVRRANAIIARAGDYAWAAGCVAAGYKAAAR